MEALAKVTGSGDFGQFWPVAHVDWSFLFCAVLIVQRRIEPETIGEAVELGDSIFLVVTCCGTVLAGREGGKKLLQLQLFFCVWRVSDGRVQTFDRFMALAELEITQMLGREFWGRGK